EPKTQNLRPLPTKPLILKKNEINPQSGNLNRPNPCRVFPRDLLLIALGEFFRMRYPEPEEVRDKLFQADALVAQSWTVVQLLVQEGLGFAALGIDRRAEAEQTFGIETHFARARNACRPNSMAAGMDQIADQPVQNPAQTFT